MENAGITHASGRQTPKDVSQAPTHLSVSSAIAETTGELPLETHQTFMEVEDSPQISQTPTYVSQEPKPTYPAATHPIPPANSINKKTYCLVVPDMDNSSITLQPHVLSNTVGRCQQHCVGQPGGGYGSDTSYVSHYTDSDGQIIWQRYSARQQVLKRRRRSLKTRPWYHKCSTFVRLHKSLKSVKRPGVESLLPVLAHHQFPLKIGRA
ncbi:uncharacterized protein LOC117591251 isoform X1 [Drosophila guanche]|nr:uncharacterized protein LOC117591251 isoform X1 [Drosophila guanche]